MRQSLFMSSLALLIVTTVAVLANPSSPVPSQEQGEKKEKALLDPNSSRIAVLMAVFEKSGYVGQATADAASYCLRHHEGAKQDEFVFPEKAGVKGAALIDPRSNPLVLLINAFEASGWSIDEAVTHATFCFYGGKVPNGDGEGDIASNCVVHRMKINYCQSGQERVINTTLTQPCYDALFVDPPGSGEACLGFECTTGVPWWSLTPSTNCDVTIPGTCVEVYIDPESVSLPCVDVDGKSVDCDCFVETTPGTLDCDHVEVECCPYDDEACSGCPSC